MVEWTFLTNHGRAMLLIAAQPDTRLSALATALDVTERTAFAVVADLATAGYVVKERDGRRNRYHIEDQLPLPDSSNAALRAINNGRDWSVRELLRLLIDPNSPEIS